MVIYSEVKNIEIYTCVCRSEGGVAKARSRQWNLYNGYISVVSDINIQFKAKAEVWHTHKAGKRHVQRWSLAWLHWLCRHSTVSTGQRGRVTHVGEALHSALERESGNIKRRKRLIIQARRDVEMPISRRPAGGDPVLVVDRRTGRVWVLTSWLKTQFWDWQQMARSFHQDVF